MTCCMAHVNGVVVEVAPGGQVFQVDSLATLLTSSTSFVTLATLAGDAKVKNASTWKINMCVAICCPYATAGTQINAETLWEVETSTGVFAQLDKYSVDEHITIFGSENSSPRHRTITLNATMDAPRMRVRCRRTAVGGTGFYWEHPRFGGAEIL